VIYTVEEIQSILHPVFESEGVIRAILFGSYAKGSATEGSDIDIAALVDDEMSILNFCNIADKVINKLGKNVDFIYADDIIPGGKIDIQLKKDGVLLYERS
jgi:predicted nucleotidyltransferase